MLSMEPPTFDPIDPMTFIMQADDFEELEFNIKEQLHDFVHMIASMYKHENSFHNFEHAAHVVMSVVKLLHRMIPSPSSLKRLNTNGEDEDNDEGENIEQNDVRNMYLDPITPFTCVLAALIHDVDYNGIPTSQTLSSTDHNLLSTTTTAKKQNSGISSEQNAIHVAWTLLTKPDFYLLRQAIFGSSSSNSYQVELNRFQYIFVRMVSATEKVNHDRTGQQYHQTIHRENMSTNSSVVVPGSTVPVPPSADRIDSNIDATTEHACRILECVMQASDVSHMMQHWHIYMKWNERLLNEYVTMYNKGATKSLARSQHNSHQHHQHAHPSQYWYQHEVQYMEQYVFPLAQTLRDELDLIRTLVLSSKFTSSSVQHQMSHDEYCQAAVKLRDEWVVRGPSVITEMMTKMAFV
jgi:D-ribose pyranose/furanose isomerase RbsD